MNTEITAKMAAQVGGAGAVVTGLVAEAVVVAADAAGMSLERVALLVGVVTFFGSFVSATFLLGGRVRDWSNFQKGSEHELKRLRAELATARRDREALIRALIRAGVLDEEAHGIVPERAAEHEGEEDRDDA